MEAGWRLGAAIWAIIALLAATPWYAVPGNAQLAVEPPELPPFVYVVSPPYLFFPNESLRLEAVAAPEAGGYVLVTRGDWNATVVRLVYWNNSVAWSAEIPGLVAQKLYYDSSLGGSPSLVLVMGESTLSTNRTLVILDALSGSVRGSVNLRSLLGNESAHIGPTVYDARNDTIYTVADYASAIQLVAVDTGNLSIRWRTVWNGSEQDRPLYIMFSEPSYDGVEIRLLAAAKTRDNNYTVYALRADARTGNLTAEHLIARSLWPKMSLHPTLPYGVLSLEPRLWLPGSPEYYVVQFTPNSTLLVEIANLTGAFDYVEYCPNGPVALLEGYNSSASTEGVAFLDLASASVYSSREWGSQYMYNPVESGGKWSPQGCYNVIHLNTLAAGEPDRLIVVDALTGVEVLNRTVGLIYTVEWGPSGDRFYVVDNPIGESPELYTYSVGENFTLLSTSIVFHPYNSNDLLAVNLGGVNTVYYIDWVSYDSEHGYWNRVYAYRLVESPLTLEIIELQDDIVALALALPPGTEPVTLSFNRTYTSGEARVGITLGGEALVAYRLRYTYVPENGTWRGPWHWFSLIFMVHELTVTLENVPEGSTINVTLGTSWTRERARYYYSPQVEAPDGVLVWHRINGANLTLVIETTRDLASGTIRISNVIAEVPLYYLLKDPQAPLDNISIRFEPNIAPAPPEENEQPGTTTPGTTTSPPPGQESPVQPGQTGGAGESPAPSPEVTAGSKTWGTNKIIIIIIMIIIVGLVIVVILRKR